MKGWSKLGLWGIEGVLDLIIVLKMCKGFCLFVGLCLVKGGMRIMCMGGVRIKYCGKWRGANQFTSMYKRRPEVQWGSSTTISWGYIYLFFKNGFDVGSRKYWWNTNNGYQHALHRSHGSKIHALQHLGITHILCLCANDFGQTDSQLLDIFQYKISRLLLDTLLIFSIWFGEILVS